MHLELNQGFHGRSEHFARDFRETDRPSVRRSNPRVLILQYDLPYMNPDVPNMQKTSEKDDDSFLGSVKSTLGTLGTFRYLKIPEVLQKYLLDNY